MKLPTRMASRRNGAIVVMVAGWLAALGSCTTPPKVDPLPPLPEAPAYTRVPHPDGLDYADLVAVFTDREAPSIDSLKECDADFLKLRSMVASKDELDRAARELIQSDPVKYHWCFYGKLLTMHDQVRNDVYLDDRQKRVVDTYVFLAPIARAFMAEYQDSRYLRWATASYRKNSEFVFFRRLELGPDATADLAHASNPFLMVRPPKAAGSVLEKYGLVKPAPAPAPEIAPEIATAPAVVPSVTRPEPAVSAMPEAPEVAAQPQTVSSPLAEVVAPSNEKVAAEPLPSPAPVVAVEGDSSPVTALEGPASVEPIPVPQPEPVPEAKLPAPERHTASEPVSMAPSDRTDQYEVRTVD